MMKMIRDGRTGNRVSMLITKLCTIKMVSTTTTKMMMITVFKIALAYTAISLISMFAFHFITTYLGTKPQSNKFRQWWSNHICDLDGRYQDYE